MALAKVTIAEFTELALCCPANQTMLIVGDFGIGKTQVVRKVAKLLKLDCVEYDCTHLTDPGDILGLPCIVNGRTCYNPTSWYSPDKPVLLFIDEVFRAVTEVRGTLMPLTLEQKIADLKLAPGSRIICAANPPGYHGYEGEVPDAAQLSRYAAYWLDPTFNEWMDNAKEIGCHQAVIDYLNDNKRDLDTFTGKGEEDVNTEELTMRHCRRSWIKLSDNLKTAEQVKGCKLERKFVIRIASGYIEGPLAVKFAPFYENCSTGKKNLTAEKVLDDWANIQKTMGLDEEGNPNTVDLPTGTKLINDIKYVVKDAKKIPAKWKNNFNSFFRTGLNKETQVAVLNDIIYNDMMNSEDWVFQISDDELQSFYEELIASKVA